VLHEESQRLLEAAAEEAKTNPSSDWSARTQGCIFQPVPAVQQALFASSPKKFCEFRCRWPRSAGAASVLLGEKLRQTAATLLGTRPWLFNEQYIVKPPRSPLSAFAWHRDSDWVRDEDGVEYHPYVSVWCALDDTATGNGTLSILPFGSEGAGGSPTAEGGLRAIELCLSAGDAVAMSDRVWHSSGPNLSRFSRAAWMPQFSAGPISRRGAPVALAIPLPANRCGG